MAESEVVELLKRIRLGQYVDKFEQYNLHAFVEVELLDDEIWQVTVDENDIFKFIYFISGT